MELTSTNFEPGPFVFIYRIQRKGACCAQTSYRFPAFSWTVTAFSLADEWNKNFPVTAKPDFHLITDDANLNVVSSDAKEIRVNVTTRGWKIPDDVKVVEHQEGNHVNVEVRMVHKQNFHSAPERSIRVAISVPRETNLDLRTGDGNVVVDAVKGSAHISHRRRQCRPERPGWLLNASTGDGNLKVRGRFDDLNLHTGDGNMNVYVATGSKASSSWILRTGDGNLDLHLPDGFSAELDAHTGDGRISSDFPVTTTGGLRENELRGKMNAGGSTLELRTGDGSIHVSKL